MSNMLLASAVRQLKTDLPRNWDGSERFHARQLKAIEVEYTDEEKQVHRIILSEGCFGNWGSNG